jgi:hypothetical protein
MTPRTRDTLLLIAGLPGVVAIFLPVTSFFAPISPVHFLLTYSRNPFDRAMLEPIFWFALPVLLPMAVAVLQLHRLVWGTPPNRPLTAAWTAVALLTTACFALALQLLWHDVPAGEGDMLPGVVLVVLTGANLVCLYRNLRRRRPLALIAELLMLGTYVAVMTAWLIDLLKEPYIGPKLIFWTCLVYLATIAIRLRASPTHEAPSA